MLQPIFTTLTIYLTLTGAFKVSMEDLLDDFNPVLDLLEVEETMGDIVDTTSGVFVATNAVSKTNKTVKVFYGIPYAKPPIGELRFRPPQPADRKAGLKVAEVKGSPCYQYGPEKTMKMLRKLGYSVAPPYSEDCLTLNIWLPFDPETRRKLPVMVFIHGGGFYLGSSVDYYSDGTTLVSEENVIVVSMNYRLGTLGFLNLGLPEEAPGNAGLIDQQMALKWIKNNIAKFGGDPTRITIFGVSSGAASVGYHLISPGSQGLFQQAILMSGVPLTGTSFNEATTVQKQSIAAARNLNYKGSDDPYEVLTFLRSKSAEEVNLAADLCGDGKIGPTIDGQFIPEEPEQALVKAALGSNVRVMIGTTSDEGTFEFISRFPYLYTRDDDSGLDIDEFELIVRSLDADLEDEEVEAIIHNYLDYNKPKQDPLMIRDAAIKALGDYLVFCDSQDFADVLADIGLNVYRYIFDGRANVTQAHVPKWSGALHGCDGLLLFGDFLDSDTMTSDYLEFVRDVMRKFANFARTGSPNLETEETRIKSPVIPWPLYSKAERATVIVRTTGDVEVSHPRSGKCAIWKHLSDAEETTCPK